MNSSKDERTKWTELLSIKNPWFRGYFIDEEVLSLCGIADRTLRLIQTTGYISSIKAKRVQGAQIRVWPIEQALRAALVCETSTLSGLSIPTTIKLLQQIPYFIQDEFINQTVPLIQNTFDDNILNQTELDDWLTPNGETEFEHGDICLSIVNTMYVYVEGRFPELAEDAEPGTDTMPIGLVSNIYGQNAIVSNLLSGYDSDKLIAAHMHPISIHTINLELALRNRLHSAISKTLPVINQ